MTAELTENANDERDHHLTKSDVVGGHGPESVNLKNFFGRRGLTLAERVDEFFETYNALEQQGSLRFSRTVVGASSNKVVIETNGCLRTFDMFGSNNYLDLATHPHVVASVQAAMERFGFGIGGPPLLNGTTDHHRALEKRLAQWKGTEDAVLFSSGFAANMGVVSAICSPGDTVFMDEYSHASVMEGLRSAGVRARRFPHGDMVELERLLVDASRQKNSKRGETYIFLEGLYSMDGDVGKVDEAWSLAQHYGATLVIDDAHGGGVLGSRGSGALEEFGIHGLSGGKRAPIVVGTLSKSFASTGGFVAASRSVCHYIRYFARSYVFSASMNHGTVAGALAVLDVLNKEPERVERLRAISRYLIDGLRKRNFPIPLELVDTPIVPILIPDLVKLREVSHRLHQGGYFVNAIEYPAVPEHLQRLRLSVMSSHSEEQIDGIIECLVDVRKTVNF